MAWYPQSWSAALYEGLTGHQPAVFVGRDVQEDHGFLVRRLDEIKSASGSDKATSQALGVSDRLIRYWRRGERNPGPAQVAALDILLRRVRLSPARERRLKSTRPLTIDALVKYSQEWMDRRFKVSSSAAKHQPKAGHYDAVIDRWLDGDDITAVDTLVDDIVYGDYGLPNALEIKGVYRIWFGHPGDWGTAAAESRRGIVRTLAEHDQLPLWGLWSDDEDE